jgi:3-keto-5-aminohexanoate cleavage enzyme
LILCVSCSGRQTQSFDERAEVLELKGDLKPDLASLTLSSVNFTRQASVNAPDVVQALAQRMLDHGVKPEIEIFDLGMLNVLGYLQARSLIRPPIYANLLLGNIASAQADFLEIGTMISKLPQGTIWSLAGIGAAQLPVAAMAAAAAPGVRIGLEDNLWLDAGRDELATNMEIIERVQGLCRIVNREFMSPLQLRRLLELPHATACGDSASGYAA